MLRRHVSSEVSPFTHSVLNPLLTLHAEAREKQWHEELERQKHTEPERRAHEERSHRRHDYGSEYDDDDKAPQPLLDQKPAVPGIDPRDLTNPATVPTAPGGLPVPDIRLENLDPVAANYSTNV